MVAENKLYKALLNILDLSVMLQRKKQNLMFLHKGTMSIWTKFVVSAS